MCLPTALCSVSRRFLNRLLGVEVARQNLLFNYFMATLAAEIKAAKEEGRYSEGVSDLPVTNIQEPPEPQVPPSFLPHPLPGPQQAFQTELHRLGTRRGGKD